MINRGKYTCLPQGKQSFDKDGNSQMFSSTRCYTFAPRLRENRQLKKYNNKSYSQAPSTCSTILCAPFFLHNTFTTAFPCLDLHWISVTTSFLSHNTSKQWTVSVFSSYFHWQVKAPYCPLLFYLCSHTKSRHLQQILQTRV